MTGLRLAVTLGLVALLATRFDFGRATELMLRASPQAMAAALAALVLSNLFVGLRWHLILSPAAPSPGAAALTKLVFVGLFFNQVLPTGVGGDAVRAWRCRRLGIGLGVAIRSILLDRAWGYSILVILYIAGLPTLLRVLPNAHERAGVTLLLAGAVAALFSLLSLDWLPAWLTRIRALAPFFELSRQARALMRRPGRCAAVLALSVLTIGLSIVALEALGDAVGTRLPLIVWAVISPPVALIQLLPVSLAGWGVREIGLVVALGAFGVQPEAALAISILSGLCLLLVGLPGGLIWLSGWDIRERTPGEA